MTKSEVKNQKSEVFDAARESLHYVQDDKRRHNVICRRWNGRHMRTGSGNR